MVNLLTFYGSCGHVTTEVALEDEWETAAEGNYNVYCFGVSIRKVYVRPSKPFTCVNCQEEETYSGEFATLRYFFKSPDKYSRNESAADRETQTIALGKSMLPGFSSTRILEIAKSNLNDRKS